MLALTPFRLLPRAVQIILLLNLAVFLPAMIMVAFAPEATAWLAAMVLIPMRYAEVWRFVTYAFVHWDPVHFLFNMLMLWMFGDEVAKWLGNRSFTVLYLLSAVVAGMVSIPFYMGAMLEPSVQILGASGALYGVMVAYAGLFPDRQMLLFMIIPVRARTAVLIFIAIDVLLLKSGDGVAHFTHLGGALAGLLFLWGRRNLPQGNYPGARLLWNIRKQKVQSAAKSTRILEGDVGYYDEQMQLDKVLAKISKSGIQSLRPDEVAFLQEASQRNRARRGF